MRPSISPSTPTIRRSALAVLAATALALSGCGGGSSDAEAPAGEVASSSPDSGTGVAGEQASTTDAATGDSSASAADVCEAIPAEDVQAILEGADPITATPNEVIPTPTCDYTISLEGGGTTLDAAVVQIQLSGDVSYFEGQEAAQTDADAVPELDQGLVFNDGGTILLTTDAGTWTIIRGVETTDGGSEQATPEQMVAIAELVQERL